MPGCNRTYLVHYELEVVVIIFISIIINVIFIIVVNCDGACLQEVQQALASLLEQSLQLQWWVGLCCWSSQPSSFAAAAQGGTQEQLLWKLLR